MKDGNATLRRATRPSELCSISEAALRARLNPFTIWRWIREGKIPAYGRPGYLRVSVADLLPDYDPSKDQGK
jgi:hypothetical protein